MDNLEQTVEREMALLRGLPTPTPRPEVIARVRDAVLAEAQQVQQVRRFRRVARLGLGVAAALLLAVGWVASRPNAADSAADSELVLSEWAAALDESNQRLTQLVDVGWTPGEPLRDEEGELDDLLHGLDRSFEHFDAL